MSKIGKNNPPNPATPPGGHPPPMTPPPVLPYRHPK